VEVQFRKHRRFKWMLLRKTPEREEIQDSVNEELIIRTHTEETRVFDQWALIKSIIVRQLDTWNKEKFLYLIDGYRFF
jgi:hypothetical protein